MDWIKRNLYFLVGGIVAAALMGLAGFYLYSKWQLNNETLAKLEADFAELDRLSKESPHPGDGKKVDNIGEAKNQQKQLREYVDKGRKFFQRIPPIPDVPKLTDHDLATALSHTVDQMRRGATNASVNLPGGYDFSFQAEKNLVSFSTNSLLPLAEQLGEVKAICEILFRAKINGLDSVQRERVCTEDEKGNQSDYVTEKTVTNDLAVLTPYQVSFRCFSPELAQVLSGFGGSPNAILVRTVNVEHGAAAPVTTEGTAVPVTLPPPAPTYVPPPPRIPQGEGAERRYQIPPRPGPGDYARPAYPQPTYPVAQPVAVPAAAPARGGLPVVIDETPLKVTMVLEVVKLATPKETAAKPAAPKAQ